jgi:hypothetical protein
MPDTHGGGQGFAPVVKIGDATLGDSSHPTSESISGLFPPKAGDARGDVREHFLAHIGGVAGLQASASAPAVSHGIINAHHADPGFLIVAPDLPEEVRADGAWKIHRGISMFIGRTCQHFLPSFTAMPVTNLFKIRMKNIRVTPEK